MHAGPEIVATDATPPRCTSRIVRGYGQPHAWGRQR